MTVACIDLQSRGKKNTVIKIKKQRYFKLFLDNFPEKAAGDECLDRDSKEVDSELDLEIIVAISPPSNALILIPKQHR